MAKKKQQARQMASAGKSPAQIKAKTGVGSQTAQRVVKNHAPPPPPPRPAPKPPKPAPKPSGNQTNKKIQNNLRSAGKQVSYKEAAAVAEKLGVSVDRVYNQTAKTGQNAKAGAAAANAGYTPSDQLKVKNPITTGYIGQATANYQQDFAAAQAQSQAAGTVNDDGTVVPEFDWEAWNTEMASQQAAIWASMDAMNSEFMRQQQEWMAQQQQQTPTATARSGGVIGGFGGADQAQVKRKKKQKKTVASGSTNTGLGIGNSGSGGVSLGGSSAGGLSIGKG